MFSIGVYLFPCLNQSASRKKQKENVMLCEDRLTLTADALARWFHTFESKFFLSSIDYFPHLFNS